MKASFLQAACSSGKEGGECVVTGRNQKTRADRRRGGKNLESGKRAIVWRGGLRVELSFRCGGAKAKGLPRKGPKTQNSEGLTALQPSHLGEVGGAASREGAGEKKLRT